MLEQRRPSSTRSLSLLHRVQDLPGELESTPFQTWSRSPGVRAAVTWHDSQGTSSVDAPNVFFRKTRRDLAMRVL